MAFWSITVSSKLTSAEAQPLVALANASAVTLKVPELVKVLVAVKPRATRSRISESKVASASALVPPKALAWAKSEIEPELLNVTVALPAVPKVLKEAVAFMSNTVSSISAWATAPPLLVATARADMAIEKLPELVKVELAVSARAS